MLIKFISIILTICIADDIDFGAFSKDRQIAKQTHQSKSFTVQTLPKTIQNTLPKVKKQTIFRKVDKFGRTWEYFDKDLLDSYINEINKKPFTAIDKFGNMWESQDKDVLDAFIAGRNNLFESIYNTGQ